MTTVDLEWRIDDARLQGVRVPVAVRTPTLALCQQAEVPGRVELAPGTYVITAKLPAGQELTRIVEVGSEAMTVELAPEESPPRAGLEYLTSPRERRAAMRVAAAEIRSPAGNGSPDAFEPGGPAAGRGRAAHDGAAPRGRPRAFGLAGGGVPRRSATPLGSRPERHLPRGWLRGLAANPLSGRSQRVDLGLELLESSDDIAVYRAGPAAGLRYLQSLHPGRPAVNVALPTSARAGCRVVVRREPERYWFEVHLDQTEGNLLLGYQRNAAPREEAQTAERLLASKLEDPIAAVLGAYSLLRFGELERLHDWPANLRDWFPWLPDGAAAHGEQLARRGDHADACAAFLEAAARGLPIFGDGIDYLYRRLELYAAAREGFPGPTLARADEILSRLHDLVGYVDFSQVVTTLNGLDPARPDDKPFTGPPPEGALDLAATFG